MTPLVRTLVAEDEPLAREALRELVARTEGFEVVALCADGQAALEAARALHPDLLLLDVEMPVMNGFSVLEALQPETPPQVIFVTAYEAYAVQAFEARAVDYVLKPVAPSRLEAALHRARKALRVEAMADHAARLADLVAVLKTQPERFLVKVGERTHCVEVGEVDWIQGADYCVVLHVGDRELVHRESLRHLGARLGDHRFLRIHGSILVNLERIKEVRRGALGVVRVVLRNGQELEVSRRRVPDLQARLGRTRVGS